MIAPLLIVAGVIEGVLAVVHSVVGERHVVRILQQSQTSLTETPAGRALIQVAWHFTALLLAVVALILIRAGLHPPARDAVIMGSIGAVLIAMSLWSAIAISPKYFAVPLHFISGTLIFSSIL